MTEALGHGLENAARYSPSGSEIAISAAVSDTAVFCCASPTADRASAVGAGAGARAFREASRRARRSRHGTPGSRSRGDLSR